MSLKSKAVSVLSERAIRAMFKRAEVTPNGSNSWDPQIEDRSFWARVASEGMLGLGDSYVDGLWNCPDLEVFFYRLFIAGLLEEVANASPMQNLAQRFARANQQSAKQAEKNVSHHYNLGNDLFQAMSDDPGKPLTYSCARWQNPLSNSDLLDRSLSSAQRRKHENICQKLGIKPGMGVLDIGCGWGGFAWHAAQLHGAHVTGITLSESQIKYIQSNRGDLPIEPLLLDYRDLDPKQHGKFDAIVSIGMFEHVGLKNFQAFFEAVERSLKPGGIALIHFFGRSHEDVPLVDPWTEKYIFPGIYMPTLSQVIKSAEGIFDIRDVEEMGIHYWRTLQSWYRNFMTNWDSIKDRYDERFYRMWTYYLQICAAAFRARKVPLWQTVWTKVGDLNPSAVYCPRV